MTTPSPDTATELLICTTCRPADAPREGIGSFWRTSSSSCGNASSGTGRNSSSPCGSWHARRTQYGRPLWCSSSPQALIITCFE